MARPKCGRNRLVRVTALTVASVPWRWAAASADSGTDARPGAAGSPGRTVAAADVPQGGAPSVAADRTLPPSPRRRPAATASAREP